MKTYNFNYTVTPKEGDNSWWCDIRHKDWECEAETLEEAKEMFADALNNMWCVEISKTARKNPEKMYRDRKDAPPKVVGYVFTGHHDVEFESGWKQRICWVWTEIREMNYPEELAAA